MAKYECVGYRRMEGISKKTNKPYSFTTVYALDSTDRTSYGIVGSVTKEFMVGNDILDILPKPLAVGCQFVLYFDEAHRVADFKVL